MAVVNLANYERRRSDINNNYSRQTAANAYGRFVAQQRGSRASTDYRQGHERQAAGLGRRGVTGAGMNSGIQRRALQNYSTGLNRLYTDQAGELNSYDLNTANYEAERQRALADLEAERAQEIAMTAAQLEALRPFLGN